MKEKGKYKFAVGDRVVYRCRGFGGNGILDGKTGVVKHISRYAKRHDYDVEFDEQFPDCMDLAHFGIKPGHGWACTEEHLDREDGSDEEDDDPDIKNKRRKRKEPWQRELTGQALILSSSA